MNCARMIGAAAAWMVFFIYGFLVHGMLIAKDYILYPEGVYMLAGLTGICITSEPPTIREHTAQSKVFSRFQANARS